MELLKLICKSNTTHLRDATSYFHRNSLPSFQTESTNNSREHLTKCLQCDWPCMQAGHFWHHKRGTIPHGWQQNIGVDCFARSVFTDMVKKANARLRKLAFASWSRDGKLSRNLAFALFDDATVHLIDGGSRPAAVKTWHRMWDVDNTDYSWNIKNLEAKLQCVREKRLMQRCRRGQFRAHTPKLLRWEINYPHFIAVKQQCIVAMPMQALKQECSTELDSIEVIPSVPHLCPKWRRIILA